MKHYFIKGISDRGIPNYKTPEYRAWDSMKKRCLRPWHRFYNRYGGRGIVICNEWLDSDEGFKNFCQDMGPKPPNTTLDRIDNDGDYTPYNCRWATWQQQANNKTYPMGASGYQGVRRSWSRWRATIEINEKAINLGTFNSPKEAHHVFKDVKSQIIQLT